ncbi:hypothetical protein_gp178 [Bacillus phage vB_BceM_WH1]|nr:hypothetical protein_gp178 [Bacillus phage vB_BceM_WH1]
MEHATSAFFIIMMTVASAFSLWKTIINLQYIKFYIHTGQEDNSRFQMKKKMLFLNIVFAIFFLASLLAELLTRYA